MEDGIDWRPIYIIRLEKGSDRIKTIFHNRDAESVKTFIMTNRGTAV